jgi:hypothetical protein
MSLTSFIQSSDIKARFKEEFHKPRLNGKQISMTAPPMTENYRIVGAAFDYLLRFYLQRVNTQSVCSSWVASNSVQILKKGKTFSYDIDAERLNCENPYEAHKIKAGKILRRAERLHSKFINDGKLTTDLLGAVMQLAYLDSIYRAPAYIDIDEVFSAIDMIDIRDIKDLKRLIGAVDFSMLRSEKRCFLNPNFGDASTLVGGADADIIIDDIIIDIKTTKHLRLSPEDYYQLIGYYVLSLLGKLNGGRSRGKIKRLGIYFSRYSYLYTFNVKDIIKPDSFAIFLEWFQQKAAQRFKRLK